MIETSRKILVVKENPCVDCGIKGIYENCEDKCVQYKKWYQYQQGREDAIEEVINLLAKKEDTMLSDKQYYTIVELKKK